MIGVAIRRIFIVVKYSIALCLRGIIAKCCKEKCQSVTVARDRHGSGSSPGLFCAFFFFHRKGATKSYKSTIDLTPAVSPTEALASAARVSRPLSIPICHQDFGSFMGERGGLSFFGSIVTSEPFPTTLVSLKLHLSR